VGKLTDWSCSPHDPKPGYLTLRLKTRWTTANVHLTPDHARVLVGMLERTAASVEPRAEPDVRPVVTESRDIAADRRPEA
jgi:hypothetical protein